MAHRVDALEAVVLAKDEVIRVLQDELDSLTLRFERMRDGQYPATESPVQRLQPHA
jgi:uncharacterized coiled-coil protein SlyX